MPNRPQLILLPGQLCDEALWAPQISGLADIADMSVADLTLDDNIEAMADRVLAMASPTFALAALSLGGYVALEIATRVPERVSRLALMNTSARPDTEDQSNRRERSVRAARIGTFKGVTPRFLPTILAPENATDPEIAGIVLAMTERVGRRAFERQQAAAMDRPDFRPLLGRISCPTLVIGGRQDQVTPPALQEEIAAGIAGARLATLDKCGHLAPLEQPQAVNRLLRELLA
jgi:pimeloyl-ACP methyl ester carboxylesterase